ncbi:dCTP deaminase domain-containing protein [Undibacter mobilis]|uniref:Helix-turn-helix domain-containing protein n=1 Tax=Undibacter mobilis TaxID=2292256 RepID=A0A371B9K9_9BRAD|nr:helix-turn-helix domain-containing protein [Undibacter mobilis]RDV04061.1 helix-turn-helix domain-containing protein [Undibacter mobilis]
MAASSRGKTDPESTIMRASPGAHLRAELRRLGLDQVAVSKATGVSRQSVNNIINGRQAISRAMAGKLGRLTGHGSDYWLSEWFSENGAPVRAAISGILVNHQIARAVHDGIIAIEPFISGHLRPASIDLTLGTQAVSEGRKVALSLKRVFALRPGGLLSATTAEHVELPLDHLGRLGGLTSLSAAGLVLNAPLQIAPGFRGVLRFALFNAGSDIIPLRAGEPIAALEIMRLAAAPEAS